MLRQRINLFRSTYLSNVRTYLKTGGRRLCRSRNNMFVTVTLPASQYNIRTYVDIQLETNDISNKLRTYNHIMCNKSNIVIILIIYTYQYQ